MMIRGILLLAAMASTATAFTSTFMGRNQIARPVSTSSLTMKIYDWKRREADETAINDVDNFEFGFSTIKPAPGSKHRKSRKGRGIAAGQGATCGFGMRGQKSRSGSPTRPGFEGGQQPLYRRLPKFVGKPMGPGHQKTEYNIIKLDQLNGCQAGDIVSFDALLTKGSVNKSKHDIHKIVVGREEFTAKDITVQAHAFTKTARSAIEAAGGKCQLLKPTTGEVIEA